MGFVALMLLAFLAGIAVGLVLSGSMDKEGEK